MTKIAAAFRIFPEYIYIYTMYHISVCYIYTYLCTHTIYAVKANDSMVVVVQLLSLVQLFVIPWTAACQPLFPSPRACPNSCPSSQWCHPTISSSVVPLSSCLQSFPASESLPMSQFFVLGGQSIGASASASVLPMNIQDLFPLGLTSLISLQSRRLSRVFSNTTVRRHQFFSAPPSLWSKSHILTWLMGKP